MQNACLGAVPCICPTKVQNLHGGMPKLPFLPSGAALTGDLHSCTSQAIANCLPCGGFLRWRCKRSPAHYRQLTLGAQYGTFWPNSCKTRNRRTNAALLDS